MTQTVTTIDGFILPLKPYPQRLVTQLGSISYNLRTRWSNASNCWMMDIADEDNVPIVGSIPLVTGADLLEQYRYLAIGGGGGLYSYSTIGPPDAVAGFLDLGVTSFVVFIPDTPAIIAATAG
jgi:hypothetical protein